MPIILPSSPLPRALGHQLVSSRFDQTPVFAGNESRTTRLGSRWALRFTLPTLTCAQAREWTDLEDEASTVVLGIPQLGLTIGTPGTPVVDGGGQLGNTLNVRGCSADYSMVKGQWLTVITASQRYLYQTRDACQADGSGDIAIPVRPLLRVSPADGDTVEIAAPKIEGFVRDLPSNAFEANSAGHVTGLQFTIRERG